MFAYLMSYERGLWLCFGEDPVQAAKTLPLPDGEWEYVSVSGKWPVDQPIDLNRLWPYFSRWPRYGTEG